MGEVVGKIVLCCRRRATFFGGSNAEELAGNGGGRELTGKLAVKIVSKSLIQSQFSWKRVIWENIRQNVCSVLPYHTVNRRLPDAYSTTT